MVGRSEQDGLPVQRDAPLTMLQHAATDRVALVRLVQTGHEQGTPITWALGPQGLDVAFGRQLDHRVRRGQDRSRRPVVLLEPDDPRPHVPLWEFQDVAHGGRAERIDRLGVVSHHGDVPRRTAQVRQDVGLQRVGVLVLVDQDVVEEPCQPAPGALVGRECPPVEEQVVVVQDVVFALSPGVSAKDGPDPVDLFPAPWKIGFHHLREPSAGVDRPGVDGRQGVFPGEPTLSL